MSEAEQAFVDGLAEALGPLYRVSLIDGSGRLGASAGTVDGEDLICAQVKLPGSESSVMIEFNHVALVEAQRALERLSPRPASSLPPGSFTHLDGALEAMIALAEQQIGRPIAEMTKAERAAVVRILDERGAFELRRSVETVADLLGVSRFTVYNYLDSSRQA